MKLKVCKRASCRVVFDDERTTSFCTTGSDSTVGHEEGSEHAKLIVKAVNHHQELVDALDELMDALDEYNYLSNKTEKAYHKAFNLLKDVKNK